jgi:hypothetical protein
MIGPKYLLKKPAPPSPVKLLVDQSIIPSLIDAAAAVEQQIERIAVCARRAPMTSLGVAFGLGLLASQVFRTLRRPHRLNRFPFA